ncbi:hypothetical protein ACFQ67_17255 [Streptomyces sp. NPDC056488]|uniref:hypothetical protein n=1 Tax=Streptomyces sp. NPDC056488 TaxID=3345836 RepID=UPI0036B762CD
MAEMNHWRNNPHWYWAILLPLLVALIIEDDTITRSLLASGLLSGAVAYGREWMKWSSRRALAERAN